MPDPKDAGRQVRPFAAVLTEHARGVVHASLSEQLADLTAAVAETGKKGTLALTITIEPVAKGAAGALKLGTKVVVKAPQDDTATPTSVFFADGQGNLTRDDPRQPRMEIRGVATIGETA